MYEKIYHFNLLDEMKQGKTVFCCDKKALDVFCMNEQEIGTFAEILADCEKDETRYEFWIEKEGK